MIKQVDRFPDSVFTTQLPKAMKIVDRPLTPECLMGFLGKKTWIIEKFIIKGEGLGYFCGKQHLNLLVLESSCCLAVIINTGYQLPTYSCMIYE